MQARLPVQHYKPFKAKRKALEKIEGIGEARAGTIKGFADFSKAEKETIHIDEISLRSGPSGNAVAAA